jgi:hypothetical protein
VLSSKVLIDVTCNFEHPRVLRKYLLPHFGCHVNVSLPLTADVPCLERPSYHNYDSTFRLF